MPSKLIVVIYSQLLLGRLLDPPIKQHGTISEPEKKMEVDKARNTCCIAKQVSTKLGILAARKALRVANTTSINESLFL